MSKKISNTKASSLRAYTLNLQNRALVDIAELPQKDRDDATLKLMAALGFASPYREQLFVDLIVQDIKTRRKKARVAA